MTKPYFFGYGSLVNLKTHSYANSHPAKLRGWRRIWRQTDFAPRPILTVEPCKDVSIEGLIAHVPNGDWQALDAREHAYDRELVSQNVIHNHKEPLEIATYVVPPTKYAPAIEPKPIYLSYLDVVVQGYLAVFGQSGAEGFFDSTVGWDAPIRDDRMNPVYPRHQRLSRADRDFVDQMLQHLGCQISD